MKKSYYKLGAAMTVGMIVASSDAHAAATSGSTFSTIAQNITTSTQDIPGLLTGLSYLFGILLGVLGIMKIKDHVDNPGQTPLKDGAIRLAAGGALFALPIMFQSMYNTIGSDSALTSAQIRRVNFNVVS